MIRKVALITGASRGIGKGLAYVHAENGGDLILVSRNKEELDLLKGELEDRFNINVYVIPKDLTFEDSVKEVYYKVKELGIKVDYLINNAGFGGRGFFHERNLDDDVEMIKVNILAVTILTRLFLNDFIENGSGRILNVSSTAAFLPGPLQSVYYGSKAYVTYFGNAITEELRNTNITVTTLMPGATETGFSKRANMSNTKLFNNTTDPMIVAKAGYSGMLAGKLDVIIGVPIIQRVLFSIVSIIPKKLLLRQVYKLQE